MTRDRVEAIAGKPEPDGDSAPWLDAIKEVHGYEPNPQQVASVLGAAQVIENPADGDQVEIYAEAEKFIDGPLPSVLDQKNLRNKDKVFVETEFAPLNSDDDGNFNVVQEADAVRRLHKVTKTERETSAHEVEPGEDPQDHRISMAARDVEDIAKTLRGMREHLEPVGDELPQELADLDLDEMLGGLEIEPVRPPQHFAPDRSY